MGVPIGAYKHQGGLTDSSASILNLPIGSYSIPTNSSYKGLPQWSAFALLFRNNDGIVIALGMNFSTKKLMYYDASQDIFVNVV